MSDKKYMKWTKSQVREADIIKDFVSYEKEELENFD